MSQCSIRSLTVGAFLLGSVIGPAADPVAAQSAAALDTYEDAGVAALMERARAARLLSVEGIDSYEGKLRQRMYVGLTGSRFRRERGLFEHERIAFIRWTSDGRRVIQWTGVRTAVPVAGIDTRNPRGGGLVQMRDSSISVRIGAEGEQNIVDDLLGETDMPGFDFDPGGDRLRFGGSDWALDPLSDTAAAHYTFASGDTLVVSLPANEREVALLEVRVRPRRADFHLVAGSLWFDSETASLVRATYKPARPFNMAIDEPDDSDDVPGFLQPVVAEIAYITIEYSLQELKYWLPRRFAFQGEARLGGMFRIPITVEWTVGQYLVNEPTTDLLVDGELPEGWRRQENMAEDEDSVQSPVLVIVPPSDELRYSPDLSDDFGEQSPSAFTDAEIRSLQSELSGLLPTYRRFRPQVAWGTSQNLVRFNRVEGLSVGVAAKTPLTPSVDWSSEVRIGSGDRTLNVSSGLTFGPESGRWSVEGYSHLQSMNENDNPFGLLTSVSNFVLGSTRSQFMRATGATAGYQRIGQRVRYGIWAFADRQRAVELHEDFAILGRGETDTIEAVLAADEIDIRGGRASVGWFRGVDPNGLILTSRLTVEAAGGDATYQRLTGSLSASHPLVFGLAGAVEVGGGALWGDEPLQRKFFIGGSETVRGFNTNGHIGPAFWRGRAEIATGLAAARIGLFTDAAWVGERADFVLDPTLVSVGIGASLLDGLFRLDLARAIRGGRGWKLHLYLDGLF